jgi:tryptophanyl-tRNA synthetase
MMIDWLSAGLDPEKSTLFVQSLVPEHAELFLFLSMITPVPWLERNPTYKDQIVQIDNKDLSTFGFLGYPVLQAADIIMYKADGVPVASIRSRMWKLPGKLPVGLTSFTGMCFLNRKPS